MIQVKRVYDPAGEDDGYRVLIDRLWPRGMKKADLRMDEWAKDLAPSTALRRAYHEHPDAWRDFQKSFRVELRCQAAQDHLEALARKAKDCGLTLLSAAKDQEHNHVPVLRRLLETRIRRSGLRK